MRVATGWRPMFAIPFAFSSSFQLDASTDAVEFIFRTLKAGTITHLGYASPISNLTGVSPTYGMSLQGVTVAGIPDGTIKNAGGALGTFTVTNYVSLPPWNWVALGTPYACGVNELLASVIQYNSGTINGSNNARFNHIYAVPSNVSAPFVIQNNAGARTRVPSLPALAYKYADGTIVGYPLSYLTSVSVNSASSTPDEVGVKFTIPSWIATADLYGFEYAGSLSAALDKNVVWNVYDAADAVIGTFTHLSAYSTGSVFFTGQFNAVAPVVGGGTYRIAGAPQNTNTNLLLSLAVLSDAADAGASGLVDVLDLAGHYTNRSNAGAWTDVTTSLPLFRPLLTNLTFAGGGSGSGVSKARVVNR